LYRPVLGHLDSFRLTPLLPSSPEHSVRQDEDVIEIASLFESPVPQELPLAQSVTPNAKHVVYLDVAKELSSSNVLKKHPVSMFFGEKLEGTASKVAGLELGMYHALASFFRPPMHHVDMDKPEHVQWVQGKARELSDGFSKKVKNVNTDLLEVKLLGLLKYSPSLATVLENSVMGPVAALAWSPLLSHPSAKAALVTVDELHQQLNQLLANKVSVQVIQESLQKHVMGLQAKGSLLGRLSNRIQQNPNKNKSPLLSTIAKWLAKGQTLEFTEPIVFGLVEPSQKGGAHKKQAVLNALLKASGVDTSSCLPDTPLVVKIRGNAESFEENVLSAFRQRLLVSQKVSVVSPGQSAEQAREVDLKQAPIVPTLEYILSGRYDLVHPDLLNILDQADIFEVSSSKNPAFAEDLQTQLRNPMNPNMQSLKRSMVARLLLPALCLEGTSVLETARNLALPTLIGIGLDVGKNYIPEKYAILKTVVMQAFFLGVDAADNMAGAWPEVQSLLETMGIKNVDYQSIFNEPSPESNALKAKEFLKLAFGLRGAEGEAGPAVATALRSVVIGTVVGNALSLGYTTAIGALNLSPGLRAPIGMLAIVGTSLGIALNFAANHADLSLAFKQQIHDGTLRLPESVAPDDPVALNKHCSDLAKRQLILLSGTGPAAVAFTFAPFASLSNLLGYAVPMNVVEAAITPLMPGMENLVRLGAMSKHSKDVEGVLAKFDEELIEKSSKGQSAVVDISAFEDAMYGRLAHFSSDVTLAVGGLLMGLLGRRGYHQLQIVSEPEGNPQDARDVGLVRESVDNGGGDIEQGLAR
jgi:hypothetical protein